MTENSHQPAVDAVELFRRSERPQWSGRRFQGQLAYAPSRELLDRLRKQDQADGSLLELKIDNILVSEEEDLPAIGKTAEFVFTTASHGGARFFRNAAELATSYPPLGRGKFPCQFYLVEEDYRHGDGECAPKSVKRLKNLTDFINELSRLADQKYETEGTKAWTLVFQTGDRLGLLETKFGEELLDLNIPDSAWEVVRTLTTDMEGIHQKEKLWMFKATMCEFLKENCDFHDFIREAGNWAKRYDQNLNSYLSNFSLEEVKRKISEEHSRFAEQISNMLGDITTKILSLPLAALIVMVMKTQSSGLPWWILILVMIMLSWTLHNLVAHHLRTLPNIKTNIDMVFGKLKINDFGASTDSEDVGLNAVVDSLDRELENLKSMLRRYRFVIWAVIPFLLVLFYCIGEPAADQSSELLNHAQGDSSQ